MYVSILSHVAWKYLILSHINVREKCIITSPFISEVLYAVLQLKDNKFNLFSSSKMLNIILFCKLS